MTAKIKVPHDHVLMRHPDPHASCTIEGVTYACAHGQVVVPASAAHHLTAHGFTPDGTDAAQEAPPVVEETAAEVAEEAQAEAVAEELSEIVAEIEAEPVAIDDSKAAHTPRKTKAEA